MFTRIAIWIVLFNVFVNGAAIAMDEAGMANTHGFDPGTGADYSEAEQAAEDAQSPSNGDLGTLFGVYNVLGGLLSSIVNAVPAAAMFKSLGVPEIWVDFMYTGQIILTGVGIAAFFRTGGGL